MAWLVVGLGNPGRKYERNRHNIGFMVLDAWSRRLPDVTFRSKFSGEYAKAIHPKLGDVHLLMPQTYMNDSGDSVQPAAAFLKITNDNLLVVHDEIDLSFADVRLKRGGGHAGNNGIRSMIERCGPDFCRVRVGIGRPPPTFRGEVADYVLGDFAGDEKARLDDVINRAIDGIELAVALGIDKAMNQFHAAPKKPVPPKPADPVTKKRNDP